MKLLISTEEIQLRTRSLGKQISEQHRNDSTPIVMLCLLNGGFMFFSDLVKEIDIDVECDFMRVKSYIKRNQGDIKITKDLETPVKGKHVYIVDDIFDTGNTVNAVQKLLEIKEPLTLSLVTLLTRKNSPKAAIRHLNAFTIDDSWVMGFGLDNENGYCRNYPAVYAI